jgi:hypothetical protein
MLTQPRIGFDSYYWAETTVTETYGLLEMTLVDVFSP